MVRRRRTTQSLIPHLSRLIKVHHDAVQKNLLIPPEAELRF
jgi:hypothetical protein